MIALLLSAVYIYLYYLNYYYACVLRLEFGHVWLLTTLVYLMKLHGLAVVRPETFLFCPLYVYTFFYFFCTAYCALDFARDHAP